MRANTPGSFWARVDMTGGPEACWLWLGELNKDGYGKVRYVRLKPDGGKAFAHRIAWALAIGDGKLPEGDTRYEANILHHCDTPACCNPAHLYLGTRSENAQDRENRGRGGNRTTHCPQGHPYSGDNLGIERNGRRYCKQCNRERALRYYHRRKATS